MRATLLAFGVTLGALLAVDAYAQPAPPPGPRPGPHARFDRPAEQQRMCTERFAHLGGRLGYIGAKLALTDQQQPLWDKWAQDVLGGARTERDSCIARSRRTDASPTIVDRETRLQDALTTRLQNLQKSKPDLDALYQSLTPEQRTVLDERGAGKRWHHHAWGHRHEQPPMPPPPRRG